MYDKQIKRITFLVAIIVIGMIFLISSYDQSKDTDESSPRVVITTEKSK